METYKPSIVSNVRSAIDSMNTIVVLLQSDKPIPSDVMEISYPQGTVDEFLKSSKAVVDRFRAASENTSTWLGNIGSNQSQNLEGARRVADSMRDTSIKLQQANEHISAAERSISNLEGDVGNRERELSSARQALSRAEDKLRRQRKVHTAVAVGAFATFVFAPVVSAVALTANMISLQNTVDAEKSKISSIERQLVASRQGLEGQRQTLQNEHARKTQLSTLVASLQSQEAALAAEARKLEDARGSLAQLSVQINNCLHAVNGALSSSAAMADMGTMRSVVTGLRGVADALGEDRMFAGPLSQLNEAALTALTKRVAAVKRHRLAL